MADSHNDHLLASDEEIRKLAHEHSQYSQRLDTLIQKRFLSEDEKLEEVRLKKMKLRLKDQITLLENDRQRQHPPLSA
jgi:hypothetical protein